MMEYAVVVLKLSDEDGGGYLALVPDLYGCMSDGETPEEAIQNAQVAIGDWIEVSAGLGRDIPAVGSSAKKARAREQALIDTIKILSEQVDGLDGRIERLFSEIEHVKELIENQDAWGRFERITQLDQPPAASGTLVC
jgi:antitoxin HicB